jgi:uncharacterized membrane protein YfcA
VPILVYLFSVEPVLATAYSLFIVGLTSLVGSVQPYAHGQHPLAHGHRVRHPEHPSGLRHASLVGAGDPGPHPGSGWKHVVLSKPIGILMLFAVIMVAAAYSMIRKQKAPKGPDAP